MEKIRELEYWLCKGYSFIIFQENKIVFKSKAHGIESIFNVLTQDSLLLKDAIVLDKRVGRAAALLLVKGKIRKLVTLELSKSGKLVLENNNIIFQAKDTVSNIMNRKCSSICKMELLSQKKTPESFFEVIKLNHIFE